MKNRLRNILMLPAICLLVAAGGCASGKVVTLADGLGRPAGNEAPKTEGGAKVAVIDFAYEAQPANEIGRDYDNVRSIVWEGSPGKAMADLVAAILAEKGIPAARAAALSDVSADVPVKVWGRVTEFTVNARRSGMVVVQIDARTALKLEGTGPDVAPGWNTTVTSSYQKPEPLFLSTLSGDLIHVINRAANDTAEEAVRQMVKAGLVVVPAAAERKGAEPKAEEPKPEVPAGPEPKVLEEKIGDGGSK